MATPLGDMVVRIVGDNSQFDNAVDKSKNKFTKFADSAGRIGKKLTMFVTVPLLGMAAAMVKFAIDAEETASKFGTVFRDVRDVADATAKNLVNNFGLATTKAQALLSSTGDLLKGFGATGEQALDLSGRVQELAVDLASYTNVQGGADRASAALTSAMVGEREALKSLGIVVSEASIDAELLLQGREDLEGEALLLAKAEATLEIAVRQSTDAIGDFARTSDSAANRLRTIGSRASDVAVKFGKTLLPVVERVLEKIERLVTWFANLNEGQRKTILIIGAVAAAIGPLLIGINLVTTAVYALAAAMQFLKAHPIVLVLAGIAAVVAVVGVLVVKSRLLKTRMDDVAEAMDDVAEAAETAAEKTDELATSMESLSEKGKAALPALGMSVRVDTLREKIAELKTEIAELTRKTEQWKLPLSVNLLESAKSRNPEAYNKTISDRTAITTRLAEATSHLLKFETELLGLEPALAAALENLPTVVGAQMSEEMKEAEKSARDFVSAQMEIVATQQAIAAKRGESFDVVAEQRGVFEDVMDDLIESGFRLGKTYEGNINILDEFVEELIELGATKAELKELQEKEDKDEEDRIDGIKRKNAAYQEMAKNRLSAIQKIDDAIQAEAATFKADGVEQNFIDAWVIEEKKRRHREYYEAEAKLAKAAHEAELSRAQQKIQLVQGLAIAAIESVRKMGDATASVMDKIHASLDSVLAAGSLIASMFGPEGQIIATVLNSFLIIKNALDSLADEINGKAGAYKDAIESVEDTITRTMLDNQAERNQAILDATLGRIDEEEEAELRKWGLLDKTASERAVDRIKDLKATLAETVDLEDQAAIKEQIDDAMDARKKAGIQEKYEAERIAAKERAAKEERRITRELAKFNRDIAVATAEINKAAAISDLGWFAFDQKDKVGAAYDELIDMIKSTPLPSLAAGGIAMPSVGGQIVRVAEAGVPEIISPIDRLGDIISQMPQQAIGGVGAVDTGDIHLVVQMDSKPILDKIFPATKDQTVLIHANAVVS